MRVVSFVLPQCAQEQGSYGGPPSIALFVLECGKTPTCSSCDDAGNTRFYHSDPYLARQSCNSLVATLSRQQGVGVLRAAPAWQEDLFTPQ